MENRLRCLADLKELGFQVGSGVMVGLPGQSVETLADDIALMDRLQLDMIGVGPFIPNPETRWAPKGGSLDLTLRVVAVLRLVTRVAHIPATTAMGSIDPRGREKALECGANVLMPNVTPRTHREHYRLYPGKICLDEDPSTCAACLRMRLDALGRTVNATRAIPAIRVKPPRLHPAALPQRRSRKRDRVEPLDPPNILTSRGFARCVNDNHLQ
ncbi:MAG: hypothetical protein IPJ35_09900 [Elusimicrobia bacterium]|nr:hypothetical protein [Elusimicrobiota bacterium]